MPDGWPWRRRDTPPVAATGRAAVTSQGNAARMIAALGVWGTATGWPDLVVAGIMATLFLNSAIKILVQSRAEMRHVAAGHA